MKVGRFKCLEDWMKAVDSWAQAISGLSIYDLPDCCFADWYEDGMRAQTAARKAIRMANGDE